VGVGKANDSLFFAIRPDAEAASRIVSCRDGLRAKHTLKGNPIGVDRLHLTLHHLGSFACIPKEIVGKASAAALSIHAKPFDIVFDRAKSFPRKVGNRPFVLTGTPAPELKEFHKNLGDALVGAGLRVDRHSLTPHVTLLYDEHQVSEEPIAPIRWTAREFVLLYSIYGKGRHELLGRWQNRADER